MSAHKFRVKVTPHADRIEASFGAAAGEAWGSKDLGKAVKLGSNGSAYELCTDGDEIEGFVDSMEVVTVNDGFPFGTVKRSHRQEVLVGSGTVAVGDYVVSATQAAVGTEENAKVKAKTLVATDLNNHKWRCISIVTGSGAAGDTITIEKV